MDDITTTAVAEENEVFSGFLALLKNLFKMILPLIGLGYFTKYLDD